MEHRPHYLVRLIILVTFVALAVACSSTEEPEPNASATDPSGSSVERPGAGSSTTEPAARDCTRPAGPAPGPVARKTLDPSQLQASGAEVRLPEGSGRPLAVVPLDRDVIVLEYTSQSDLPPEGGGSGSLEYTESQLRLRRLTPSGSTVWATDVGVIADWYLIGAGRVVDLDGSVLRVLWPRFDGELPAQLYGPVSASAVLTTVGLDGSVVDDVVVRQLSPPANQSPYGVPWRMTLGGGGRVALGVIDGSRLTVENYNDSGDLQWSDDLVASAEGGSIIAASGDQTYGASGGQLVRWDGDGTRRWTLDLAPSSMAPVSALPGGRDVAPAIVVSFDSPAPWMCAIGSDGRAVLTASLAPSSWGTTVGAWWGPSGLIAFMETISTGTSQELATIDLSAVTDTLQIAGSGDVLGFPGSFVGDVAVSGGELVMVGSRSDYVNGDEPAPQNLESWDFIWRLPPPTGAGDLSGLPVGD